MGNSESRVERELKNQNGELRNQNAHLNQTVHRLIEMSDRNHRARAEETRRWQGLFFAMIFLVFSFFLGKPLAHTVMGSMLNFMMDREGDGLGGGVGGGGVYPDEPFPFDVNDAPPLPIKNN